MRFDLRGRCPNCNVVRVIHTVEISTTNPALADIQEASIPDVDANCPECGAVEEVAMFENGIQTAPWVNANQFEEQNGPGAGHLPERPWDQLRKN